MPDMMHVQIDGEVVLRAVKSTSVLVGPGGKECLMLNQPELYADEQAVHFMDGRAPAIVKTLQENQQHGD